MRNGRLFAKLFVATGLAVAMVLIPGCGRTPEEPDDPPTTHPGGQTVESIGFPQTNPEIGVTLSEAPSDLVAIYNGEYWIELADAVRPRILYTLMSGPEHAPGLAVVNIDDFESLAADRDDGRFIDRGEIKTALGKARWVCGSFSEDGELIEQILMWAPHPSGNGEMIVSSTCPSGEATVDERIEMIRRLLEHVS